MMFSITYHVFWPINASPSFRENKFMFSWYKSSLLLLEKLENWVDFDLDYII